MLKNIFNNYKGESEEEIRNRVLNLADDVDCGIYSPPMKARYALNELCYYLMGEDYYYKNYRSFVYCSRMTRENKNAFLLYDLERKYKRYKPKNKIFKYVKESEKDIMDRISSLSDNTEDQSMNMNSISDQKTLNEICDHLLGDNWYIVDPISASQTNSQIVYEIEKKYKKVK